jgi:hypothetical protein
MAERVIWQVSLPGGYGQTQAVPAVVVKRTAKRAHIRVQRLTGEVVERSVRPEHVRLPKAQEIKRDLSIYQAIEAAGGQHGRQH